MFLIQLILAVSLALHSSGPRSTMNATFNGHSVHCTTSAPGAGIQASDDKAVIMLDQFRITVDPKQVTWGKDHHLLALPPGWKKVDLADDGKAIKVSVDGKTLGRITSRE